ncbi:MAG: efflux RND transporter periplasmic adaptor subunit [Saprospiraceae bacterium]|nr:efflux RND transporter periplasmic adaptor subunit [Saprospiraceae bacterium]
MNKSTRKNIVSAAITVLILICGVLIYIKMAAQKKSTVSEVVVKKERRTVQTSTFSSGIESNGIDVDGRVEAHERVNLTSRVQGVMQKTGTTIKEGKYFKKGDLLFSIDKQEAVFTLKAQKSSLMTAITQMMPDLKFDHPQSFENWLNYLNAFDVNKPIQPMPEPKSDQEKYYVTGKNILNQYYTIKSQETRLKEYNIYAPFSGVITVINVFPGTLISPGQTLATMINTEQYEISSPIPLSDLKYVKVGQSVELSSTDLSSSWNGKVNRIGTQIDAATQNIPIFIRVYGKGLKDGMYLKGKLQGKQLEDVVKLPKDIFLSAEQVYIIEDSTLVAKSISPVKRMANHVLVKGISPADKVVTGSLAGLFEGQKVNY